MKRTLTNELFIPYKEPEREFRSSMRHFKMLNFDELRSPDFNLLSDQEYSEEEVTETMAKTMKQYMSKTRANHGSGVSRPKIENKDNFELNGQFLKELLTNTFSSSDHEDANEHIEKVLEIVDLFDIPNITIDQVMLRAFPMSLTGVTSRIPTRQILDSRGAIPIKTDADAKIAIQEMAEYSQKWHNGTSKSRSTETSNGLAVIQAQQNNLGREIKKVNEKVYATQVGCEQCKGPHYTKDRQSMEDTLSKFMSESAKRHEENSNLNKEIRASMDAAERGFGSLPRSTKANLRDQVRSISTTIEADSCPIRHIGSAQYAVSTRQNRASVSVMLLLTYLNLGLGELAHTKLTIKLADMTVKYPKGIAKNVLVRIGKFIFPVDFIILDMPEDIKVPLILGRPFMSTTQAKIDVYKRKITLRVGEEKVVFTSIEPASSLIKRVYMLSLRERMELDLEARLMGETLMLNRSLDPFFEDHIELNDLNEPIKLRRNQGDNLMPTIKEGEGKMEYKGNNVIGALMNIPIFVETFSVVTNFTVLENMDAYHDEGVGDVIVGKSFLREVGIKAKRFKRHTNEQCNKIPPLLKVSDDDMMNGISHPYQKLKGFYKGVLNLGPDYIRDARMEEWLTHGHISVHEIE
uniref:Reverse transcriptase domain-containing protein n=1 Tax=Tanacetum cinerariifolium TaxID=118510 RepID=A0A6L2P8R1_TANCI|nr:hypothetical protein [Tanacetum cinerariifolium]